MARRENYNDLYRFMLVVREGSFTAAAQRLGLAQSGVSRAVRELEERLGVQLLVRTTRKLSLTQAGEQLYRTVEAGFDALDSGLSTLAYYRNTPSGTVRINASQHAIDKVLLPKLAVFKQRYPDIRWNLLAKVGLSILLQSGLMPGCVLGRRSAAAWSQCAFRPIWRWPLSARPSIFAATVSRKRQRIWSSIPVSLTSLATVAFTPGS